METSQTWLDRLAEAPADGDWRRLTDAYSPLLRAWAARAASPPTDRDDVVQEVLLVVVRRVCEFDRRHAGAFRGWLRAIVANHAKKYFRDRDRPALIDLDAVADDANPLSRVWDREHDEHLAARAMKAVEVDFAPSTWAAFRAQVIDGKPAAVAAAELSLSVNSVLLAKSRVLKRLRDELRGLAD